VAFTVVAVLTVILGSIRGRQRTLAEIKRHERDLEKCKAEIVTQRATRCLSQSSFLDSCERLN
jgi:hypothetical protein